MARGTGSKRGAVKDTRTDTSKREGAAVEREHAQPREEAEYAQRCFEVARHASQLGVEAFRMQREGRPSAGRLAAIRRAQIQLFLALAELCATVDVELEAQRERCEWSEWGAWSEWSAWSERGE